MIPYGHFYLYSIKVNRGESYSSLVIFFCRNEFRYKDFVGFTFHLYFNLKSEAATIINVTSGLAFTPFAIAPIYSARKAALHSFTMSLRLQLSGTRVEVIEVAPPAVNTDLGGSGLHVHGEPLDAFTDGIFQGFAEGLQEIGYGTSVDRLRMSRDQIDEYAAQMYEATKGYIE